MEPVSPVKLLFGAATPCANAKHFHIEMDRYARIGRGSGACADEVKLRREDETSTQEYEGYISGATRRFKAAHAEHSEMRGPGRV